MARKPIQAALDELKGTVSTIAITQSLLDAFVVFSIALLILILSGFKWYWALIPFGAYLIIHTFTTARAVNLLNIEKRVPALYEQLRTANDSVNMDNEVVDALRFDVLRALRDVRNSYFIRFGKLTSRIMTLVLTSFLIIFASSMNVVLVDVPAIVKIASNPTRPPLYDINNSLLIFNESTDQGIYGEASLAELGYEELNLQINPVEAGIDISQVSSPEEHNFQSYVPSGDIQAQQSGINYEESSVVKNNLKIVKNYFAGIANGGK